MTREQIINEINLLKSEIETQEKKKQEQLILMIVMLFIFWPCLFIFLPNYQNADKEIIRLNAEKAKLEAQLANADSFVEPEVHSTSDNAVDKLKNLKELFDNNVISEQEYKELREKIVKEL